MLPVKWPQVQAGNKLNELYLATIENLLKPMTHQSIPGWLATPCLNDSQHKSEISQTDSDTGYDTQLKY